MTKSLLVFSIAFFVTHSYAAINFTYVGDTADYTKPTADLTGSYDNVQLDITGDGTGYRISSSEEQGSPFNYPRRAQLSTLSNGVYQAWNYLDFDSQILRFNFGVNISYSGSFGGSSPGTGDIVGDGLTTGFSPNTSYYIPIFLKNSGDEYFGWIKIKTLDNDYAVVVESYAWNDQPNGAIFAGQGEASSSLIDKEQQNYEVSFANPFQNALTINSSESEPISVVIQDVNGKLVKEFTVFKGVNLIELNVHSGVYFAVIENKQSLKIMKY